MIIGIVGNGFVGNATKILLEKSNHKLVVYDLDPNKCFPIGLKFNELSKCNLIFVSVPTPMYLNGDCNTKIVEKCVNDLKKIISNDTFIIIRSTIPVGLSDKLGVYFMPEFLTEKNWDFDFRNNKSWIFGMPSNNEKFKINISDLITDSYNNRCIKHKNIFFIKNKEAELIKYFKNTFLATKVSFCNEIYQFCLKNKINYDNVIKFIKYDDRIGKTHMQVPGPDGSLGYGGTCFPKDINSLHHQFKKTNVNSIILNSVIDRNENYDRKSLDWMNNKGRAVSNYQQLRNYIVTGGAGFIGSHLCKKLLELENDIRVICIDNLITGKLENLEDIINNKRFIFVNHDIKLPIRLNINNLEKIFNFACVASPKIYQKYSLETLDTCYLGMKNILELSRKFNAKVLQASTSEVYGDPNVNIQSEDYWGNVNCFGLRSCYDEGKRITETLCYNYKLKYNLEISIARIFNTYGPNMSSDDGRVIPNFINQALNDKPITIYGLGKQTRSFCYIDDLIDGIVRLMDSNISTPVNIGNNNEYSILELANIIKKLTNSNSEIVYKDLPEDDPKIRCPNLQKAKSLLNYNPRFLLEEGLKKTINYFNK